MDGHKTVVLDASRFVPFVVRRIRAAGEHLGEEPAPALEALLVSAEALHANGSVNRAFVVVLTALALGDSEFLSERMGELVYLLSSSDRAQEAVASFVDEDDTHLSN